MLKRFTLGYAATTSGFFGAGTSNWDGGTSFSPYLCAITVFGRLSYPLLFVPFVQLLRGDLYGVAMGVTPDLTTVDVP